MVFKNLSAGTHVRLIKTVPHLKRIAVGWEGLVTEVMTNFVEIEWRGEEERPVGDGAEKCLVRLRFCFSRPDCEHLEMIVRTQFAGAKATVVTQAPEQSPGAIITAATINRG